MKILDLENAFLKLQVWRRGDERAVNKPLLLLYALGRLSRGESRLIPYAEVDKCLGHLLKEFGPARASVHPEYPFWHLQRDGLWEVRSDGPMLTRIGNNDPRKRELFSRNAEGGFTSSVAEAIQSNPTLIYRLAQAVLEANFPESIHDDLLAATGLQHIEDLAANIRSRRNPAFRRAVLTAYEQCCAVCGFDVRLGVNGGGKIPKTAVENSPLVSPW